MPAAAELEAISFMQPGGPSAVPGTLAVSSPEPAIINTGNVTASRPVVVGEGTPPVPAKFVKQIQFRQFVDFAELLPDNLELLRRLQESSVSGANEAGHRRLRQVSSLGIWVQCFAVYYIRGYLFCEQLQIVRSTLSVA